MTTINKKWICCQIGAREYYALPRALHHINKLGALITDAWIVPNSFAHIVCNKFIKQFSERYQRDLHMFPVKSFDLSFFLFEIIHRCLKTPADKRNLLRNDWFQKKALAELNKAAILSNLKKGELAIFSYSYAAINLARLAQKIECPFVLGQFDPGLEEENIVRAVSERHSEFLPKFQPNPECYWTSWLEECRLADKIIVNSEWARFCLKKASVQEDKIHVVPLAYERCPESILYVKNYPDKFSTNRPMRVLFLGQLILRKGITELIMAANKLRDAPVEFWLVGYPDISRHTHSIKGNKNIRYFGPIFSEIQKKWYYQQADLFLFPTHSDGFGLTQLEAQSWKLPIIASKFCGDVVSDKHNGLTLNEVNEDTIVDALKYCLNNPAELTKYSNASVDLNRFSLDAFVKRLSHFF